MFSPVISEKMKQVAIFYSSRNKYLGRLVTYNSWKYLVASPARLVQLWFGKALHYSRLFQGVSSSIKTTALKVHSR